MPKLVMPKEHPVLAQIIAEVVDQLPRTVNKETGEPYSGVFARDVATGFYAALRAAKHPLAEVKNENCSFDVPCGKCRRDVLQIASAMAEKNGTIIRVPMAKNKRNDNGKIIGRTTWQVYYRPGEYVASGKDYSTLAASIVSKIEGLGTAW